MPLNFFILALIALISRPAHSTSWTWKGFEIVGQRKISREKILPFIPIKIGTPYAEDNIAWEQICEKVKRELDFVYTHCSPLIYSNSDAFLVVDVVERGDEARIRYRPAPKKSIPLATAEVLSLYRLLYARSWELFKSGKPSLENVKKGYLDYDDPVMHKTSRRLAERVPPLRENLLQVLTEESDQVKRSQAANLLNWSREKLEDSVLRTNALLDDPSEMVRNNISRFTQAFLPQVENAADRETLLERLLIQLNRPSHADRNKAIVNIIVQWEKFPLDRPLIKKRGEKLIRYLAETSLVSNAGGLAKELLTKW